MGLLQKASLVITPNAVKAGKLYSVIPNNGTGDLDVVRATSATRVNEQGLIEIPRTNLLLRSEEVDNASWGKINVTVTENATTAPNGNLSADKIIATATNANHIAYNNPLSFVSSQSYTFSYYAKSAEYTKTAIRIGGAGYSIVNRAEINLSNGTIIYQQGFTSLQVQSVGNGWYRIQGTFVSASDIVPNIQPLSDSYSVVTDNYTFLGNGTSGIFVWGAQLEVGNVATEYIPTTSVIRTKFAGITQDGSSASNIPRLDYTNGSCPSILVEPQRTNLLLRSEEFDNSVWSKAEVTITPNVSISPNGSLTAVRVLISGGGFIFQDLTCLPNTVYTFSFYARLGTIPFNKFLFALRDNTNGVFIAQDLVPNVTLVTTEWRRVTYTFTTPVGCLSLRPYVYRNTSSYNVGDTFFVWGAQLEAGSNATSYIPTTTSSVTRNADVISKSGISNLIGQTEGTIYWEGSLSTNAMTIASLKTNSGSLNAVVFDIWADNRIYGYIVENNVLKNTIRSLSDITFNSFIKIAYVYKSGNCSLFINGVKQNASSQAFTFNNTISKANIDYEGYNYGQVQGKTKYVKNCTIFPTILTDEQAIQLTTL